MTTTTHKESSYGFTIVELLIVVVVIAILAAITIVSYNGIVNSAKESSAQTELSQARNKVMLASAQTGSLPDSLVGAGIQNSSIEYNVSSDKLNYCLKYIVDSISYFASTSESPNKGTCHGATGIRLGCIDKPSSCGYPDETNTGVIPGTTLRSVPSEVSSGPGWNYRADINLIQTTADNAVISNVSLDGGFIAVNHNNVTIRNSRLLSWAHYPVECDYLSTGRSCGGLTVENFELLGECRTGFSGHQYTVRRSFIHGCDDAASYPEVFEDNYVRGDSPGQGGGIVLNGDGVVIRHNTFKLASVGLEFLTVTGSGNKNWLIEENLINTIPSAIKNSNPVNGIIMRNNRFSIAGTGLMEYIPGGNWTGNYHDKDGAFIDNND